MMFRLPGRFGSDRRGTAAIQMALLMPVLVIACFGMIDTWSYLSSNINMRAGVNSAAKLVMQGVSDATTLQTTAMDGWSSPPKDAAVNVNRSYVCGSTVVTPTSLCTGAKAPSILVSIKASGTWTAPINAGALGVQRNLSSEQVIRVR